MKFEHHGGSSTRAGNSRCLDALRQRNTLESSNWAEDPLHGVALLQYTTIRRHVLWDESSTLLLFCRRGCAFATFLYLHDDNSVLILTQWISSDLTCPSCNCTRHCASTRACTGRFFTPRFNQTHQPRTYR